jgi:hypothetical protein
MREITQLDYKTAAYLYKTEITLKASLDKTLHIAHGLLDVKSRKAMGRIGVAISLWG